MFPSLVNCCTIDWFSKWPNEALLSVAIKSISSVIVDDDAKVHSLASICVLMHEVIKNSIVYTRRKIEFILIVKKLINRALKMLR